MDRTYENFICLVGRHSAVPALADGTTAHRRTGNRTRHPYTGNGIALFGEDWRQGINGKQEPGLAGQWDLHVH
ncbi:MAG: hypothetical protein RL258_1675 [Pseudomonadota bacterium]